MKYLYLLVNFFTLIIPFIYSFHPKINFHHTWSGFFPAAILVGLVFIGWDMWFTSLAVCGFNPSYLSGIYVGNLPLEEVLFFVCIPYACVFTYFCLSKFFDLAWNRKAEAIFCAAFSAVLIAVGCLNLEKIYTSLTFISTGVVSLTLRFLLKVDWWGKATTVYGILLVPFLIVNGVLTGTGIESPIVWYDHTENLNLRILTIPIEDAFYGYELILLNIYFYKVFLGHKNSPSRRLAKV